jgi:uncharacterized membrane protein
LSTHELTQPIGHVARTRTLTWRARLISTIGPLTSLGGAVWAVLQPYRVTLLHPFENSFWWLFVEPPIFVVIVGVVFHVLIARTLLEDLKASDATA